MALVSSFLLDETRPRFAAQKGPVGLDEVVARARPNHDAVFYIGDPIVQRVEAGGAEHALCEKPVVLPKTMQRLGILLLFVSGFIERFAISGIGPQVQFGVVLFPGGQSVRGKKEGAAVAARECQTKPSTRLPGRFAFRRLDGRRRG